MTDISDKQDGNALFEIIHERILSKPYAKNLLDLELMVLQYYGKKTIHFWVESEESTQKFLIYTVFHIPSI